MEKFTHGSITHEVEKTERGSPAVRWHDNIFTKYLLIPKSAVEKFADAVGREAKEK